MKETGECEICGDEFETENADYAYCEECSKKLDKGE